MKITFNLNNEYKEIHITPSDKLYDVLKKCGINSVKKSCGTGSCGACTVLLDGKPIASCSYLAAKVDGHSIITVEGIRDEVKKLAKFMTEEGAVQCGFCNPSLSLTVFSMKKELKNLTEENIDKYLVGNLCRCSGYQSQTRAIKKYLEVSE